MKRIIVKTDSAPEAIGPYSQAIVVGDIVFSSGQIPINPITGNIDATDFEGQVRQVLENLNAVLNEANSNLQNVVKFTVFVTDLNNFQILNHVFKEYFPNNPPARSAVQVSRLPKDVLVEIDAVAIQEE